MSCSLIILVVGDVCRGYTLIIILKLLTGPTFLSSISVVLKFCCAALMVEINVRGRIHQPFLELRETVECVVCPEFTSTGKFMACSLDCPDLGRGQWLSLWSHIELNLLHSILCPHQIVMLKAALRGYLAYLSHGPVLSLHPLLVF